MLYIPHPAVLITMPLLETDPHDDARFPTQLHLVCVVVVFPLTVVMFWQLQVARVFYGEHDGVTWSMYC